MWGMYSDHCTVHVFGIELIQIKTKYLTTVHGQYDDKHDLVDNIHSYKDKADYIPNIFETPIFHAHI